MSDHNTKRKPSKGHDLRLDGPDTKTKAGDGAQ